MKSFGNVDFLGDAVLRVLAYEYRPNDPEGWTKEFASNKYLAKIYRKINLDNRHPKSVGGPKPKNNHSLASYVELWLGEAYETGGMCVARDRWERMQAIMEAA